VGVRFRLPITNSPASAVQKQDFPVKLGLVRSGY
jgi:hypothetical protein